jgi:hypothetical protein
MLNRGHARNQGRPLDRSSASARELFSGREERNLKSKEALLAAGKKSRAEDQSVRASAP